MPGAKLFPMARCWCREKAETHTVYIIIPASRKSVGNTVQSVQTEEEYDEPQQTLEPTEKLSPLHQ